VKLIKICKKMESEKFILEWSVGHQRYKEVNQKISGLKWKWKHNSTELFWHIAKLEKSRYLHSVTIFILYTIKSSLLNCKQNWNLLCSQVIQPSSLLNCNFFTQKKHTILELTPHCSYSHTLTNTNIISVSHFLIPWCFPGFYFHLSYN
jgi:hypothetical protein